MPQVRRAALIAAAAAAVSWNTAIACVSDCAPCAPSPAAVPELSLRISPLLRTQSTPPPSARPRSGPPEATTHIVHVFDIDYSINNASGPLIDATITVGDTIRWVWDAGSHDVKSVVGSPEVFQSEFGVPPFTFEHTFTNVGVFWYYCTAHGFDNGNGTAEEMAGFVTVLAATTASAWNVDADGDWSVESNWSGNTVPNDVDHVAGFGGAITAARTVTVDAPQTVGTLDFDSTVSYTIAGSNALTLDVDSGQAAINVAAGAHTIAASIALNDDLTLTSAAGTGVNLSGDLAAAGRSIVKAGAGSVQFANVRAANLSVNEGIVRISAKAAANDPAGTSLVQSLSINTEAQLDLTNNSAVIDYDGPLGTQINSLRLDLQSGRLTSSSATAATGLGYADNAVLSQTTFGGLPVDSDSILIKFTYFGDSDLDGDVDVADLGALASSWQTNAPWTGGDFDYSGFVDVADLGLLASNWQAGVGAPLTPTDGHPWALAEALQSLGLAGAMVPEPGACALVGAAVLLVLRRQRRARHMSH